MSSDTLPCYTCKIEKSLSAFYKCPSKKRKYTDKCRECTSIYQKIQYKKHSVDICDKYNKKPMPIKSRLKKSIYYAKLRGLNWTITLEQFTELCKLNCFYCNGYFVKSLKCTGSGLDRIDNDKGYHIDNVLPCCGDCNRTRGDRYSVEETQQIIKLVIDLREKRKCLVA